MNDMHQLSTVAPERDAQIMVLCDRAIADLGEARTIEEVRRIGDMASVFAAYTRKIKAAIAAQNATQTVVLLAEARIGRELTAAQERGEVSKRGDNPNVRASDNQIATLSDLGIPRQRAAEMRQLADIGEDAIREAAQEATDAGAPVTRAAVLGHLARGTGENEWYTPAEYIEMARALMGGIDLDPASAPLANETVQAARIFTLDDDGLRQDWGGRVWMNPPYAQPFIMRFAMKLAEELAAGRVTEAVALTNSSTDTAWFHMLAREAAAICFTRGRIKFISPRGQPLESPLQGQAFFYFGARVDAFADAFRSIGVVMVRHAI